MRRLIPTAIVMALAACSSSTEPVEQEGTVLFEVEYTNYAWVPTWTGYYIDSGGSVWSYDRSQVKPGNSGPAERTEFTHEELMDKFSVKRAHARELLLSDVLARYQLIGPAARGQLSAPQARCADAGVLTYRAYRYDDTRKRFVPVLLWQQGDRAQANLSVEGKQLFAWLDSLKLVQRFPGCEPTS